MSTDDIINKYLGVETEDSKPESKPPAVVRKEDKKKDDIDNDHKYSREAYYDLINKGQEAIEGILSVAKEGEHPRAYEVAGQLIKSVGDTVDKLQDLNKKLKDLKELPKTADTKIQNALFVGSTAELQKMLKKDEDTKSKVINTKHRDISDK
jgi:hypothetical protein|tara:strand:- start:480 stop:935 length:456 start_codon:yes stop_codon:yes gene_type:complete